MGRKCAAVGCYSGYDKSNVGHETKRTVYKWPSDSRTRQQWLKNINRGGIFKPADHNGVCIKHFTEDCLQRYQKPGQRSSRLKGDGDEPALLSTPQLLDSAIPTLHLGHNQPIEEPSPRGHKSPHQLSAREKGRHQALASDQKARVKKLNLAKAAEQLKQREEKEQQRREEKERLDLERDAARLEKERQRQEQNQRREEEKKQREEERLRLLNLPLPDLASIAEHVRAQIPSLLLLEKQEELRLLLIAPEPESTKITAEIHIRLDLSWTIVVDGKRDIATEAAAGVANKIPMAGLTSKEQVVQLVKKAQEKVEELGLPVPTEKAPVTVSEATQKLRQLVEEDEEQEGLGYILEQLELLQQNRHARRYSSRQLAVALLLKMSSTSGYVRLRNLGHMALPSIRTLVNLSRRICTDENGYLAKRLTALDEKERVCVLIQDEVHVKQGLQLDSGSGRLIGLTEEGVEAKSILCFMLSSICGRYKDVVRMIPTTGSLSGADLAVLREEVIKDLTNIGFKITAESSDNLTGNRKSNELLLANSGDPSKAYYLNPVNGEKIFPVVDYVHIIKCVYNLFQKRGNFELPPFTEEVAPGVKVVCSMTSFECIRNLYKRERDLGLANAYQINATVLNPNALQRTNVKLALRIFNQRTIADLVAMSEQPEYEKNATFYLQTAAFLRRILDVWQILNVRCPYVAQRKLNWRMGEIRSSDAPQLGRLEVIRLWINDWAALTKGEKTGLSRETFGALDQTLKGIVALARHTLSHYNFDYFLPGKVSSDPLEARFGWYRQLVGGVQFMYTKHCLEAERKIKAISFVNFARDNNLDLEQDLISSAALEEAVLEANAACKTAASAIFQGLKTPMERSKDLMAEQQAIYYCGGALVNKELHLNPCQDCEAILVDKTAGELRFQDDHTQGTEEAGEEEDEFRPRARTFTDFISHGRLKHPSKTAFVISTLCYSLWLQIRDEAQNWLAFFLSDHPHRHLFVEMAMLKIQDQAEEEALFFLSSLECKHKHNIVRNITRRFYNTFASRYIAQRNAMRLSNVAAQRKANKLQSKSTK